MWTGGVRIIIPDKEGRILMVRQCHEGKDIWLVPGGAIESFENAKEAAVREVLEETGLEVTIKKLIWHVEEVSEARGQRFVNYFLAEIIGGKLGLGEDPEFDQKNQVLQEVKFLGKDEIMNLSGVYPEYIKTELWEALAQKHLKYEAFKIR